MAAVSGTETIGTDAIPYEYGSGITFKTKFDGTQFPDKVSGMGSQKTYSGSNDTWKGHKYYEFNNDSRKDNVYCDYYENGHYTDSEGKHKTLDTRVYMWVKDSRGPGCVTDRFGYIGAAWVLRAAKNADRVYPCVIRFEYHFYEGGTLKNGTASELSTQKGFVYFMDIDNGEGYLVPQGGKTYYTSNKTKLTQVGESVDIHDPEITYNGNGNYAHVHYAEGSYIGTTDTDSAAITDNDGANHALGVAFSATPNKPLRVTYNAASRYLMNTNDSTVKLSYKIIGTIPNGKTEKQLTPTTRYFATYTKTSSSDAQNLFNASSVVQVPGYVFSGWNTSYSGTNLTGNRFTGENLMKADRTIYGKYSTGSLTIQKTTFNGDASDIGGDESEKFAYWQGLNAKRVKFVFEIEGADAATKAFLNNQPKTVTIYGAQSKTITPMLPGKYTVKESIVNSWTEKPIWFLNSTSPQTVTVTADQTATVTFKNDLRRKDIIVQKTIDAATDLSLLSAADKKFTFTLAGTTILGTDVNTSTTINGAGSYTFKNVHPGDYTLTENATSVWKPVSVKNVVVRENFVKIDDVTTSTATFTNKIKAMPLKVHKVDKDGNPIVGAKFNVYRKSEVDAAIAAKGFSISAYAAGSPEYYTEFFKKHSDSLTNGKNFTTDADGYGQSVPLPYGTYVLWEREVPSNQLDEIPAALFTITTDADEDIANGGTGIYDLGFDLTDPEAKRSVLIIKTDNDTGEVVKKAGTSYLIYKAQNGQRTDELVSVGGQGTIDNPWVSSADGTVRIDELLPGDYCIVETQAVTGFYNQYAATGEVPVSAFFTVNSDSSSVRMYALTDGTLTTNLNLSADRYQRDHNGTILTYEVIQAPYSNPETCGNLIIQKTGEAVVNYRNGQFVYEEQPLDGAAYRVTAAEDIMAPDGQTLWYHSGDEIAIAVTGPTGRVRYLDGASYISDIRNPNCPYADINNADTGEVSLTLPLGKYTITEVHAPEGYELNATSQQAELVWQDQQTEAVEATVAFENELKKVHGDLVKTDLDTQEPMEGITFGVYNASDIKYGNAVILNADTLLGTVTTDEHGCARTEDLPFYLTGAGQEGKYYLLEQNDVPGYEPNTEKHYFPNRDNEQPFRVEVKNVPAAYVSIEKDQALNGGERTKEDLKVLPDDIITYYVTITCDPTSGRLARDMTITDTIPEGLTLVDGTISDNGVLNEDTITWTVDELGVGQSATVSFDCKVPVVEGEAHYLNEATLLYKREEVPSNKVRAVERLGSISIIKYKDEGNGKLAGVTFTLSKPDGTVVDEKTTDRSGKVKFTQLPAHDETYILRETNTVNGYQLLAEPITVTLPLTLTETELEEQNADPDKGFKDKETNIYRFYDLSYQVRNGKVFDLPMTGSKNKWPLVVLLALFTIVVSYFISMLHEEAERKRKK